VRELQEGNAISITPIPGLPTVGALGFYPTWETMLAQLVLLALFVFAVAKTFWPKRSVTLPTVTAEQVVAPEAGVTQTAEMRGALAELRAENEQLKARIAMIESSLSQPAVTGSSSDDR
jgi:hypothetical protein